MYYMAFELGFRQMLGRRFSQKQILAVVLLVFGSTFTQLAELKGPMDAGQLRLATKRRCELLRASLTAPLDE